MHASGFWHEQSRADRDEYVDIIWDNIAEGMEHNFEKQAGKMVGDYDFCSIMHYGLTDFSKNGQKTIVPKHNNFNCDIGHASTFSPMDVKKLKIYYGCSEDPEPIPNGEVTSPGYPQNYANNLDSTIKVIEVQDKSIYTYNLNLKYYIFIVDLKVEEDAKIELTFVDFNIEDEENCDFDYVSGISFL